MVVMIVGRGFSSKKNFIVQLSLGMWDRSGAYRVLVERSDENRPLGRPQGRWVDNIKVDIQSVGRGSMDWIALTQNGDRKRTFVNAAMNLQVS
jgi:hypothetical protein